MADVPLADLHVHLEGTARPALVAAIARRNGLAVPPGIVGDDDEWRWDGFLHFLTVYDRAASVIRTPEDYRDITRAYLLECAAEGAVYVELMGSPDHAADVGLSDADHVAGIAQGIHEARAATGIEARVVMIAVRNRGEAAAEAVARRVVAHPHPYVTGFGLAGDEAAWPPQRFARAFAVAHEAGLGLTVHAGEWAGPERIREALALPVTRLGHGVRAVEDPALVAELAQRRTVLEVCPSSNVATGIYPSWAEHPLGALLAAGVRVALGSDDPPYWGATIGGEYAQARRTFDLSGARLWRSRAPRSRRRSSNARSVRPCWRASAPARVRRGGRAVDRGRRGGGRARRVGVRRRPCGGSASARWSPACWEPRSPWRRRSPASATSSAWSPGARSPPPRCATPRR